MEMKTNIVDGKTDEGGNSNGRKENEYHVSATGIN